MKYLAYITRYRRIGVTKILEDIKREVTREENDAMIVALRLDDEDAQMAIINVILGRLMQKKT